jgi:hypothetical protein
MLPIARASRPRLKEILLVKKLSLALATFALTHTAHADFKSIHVSENGAIDIDLQLPTNKTFGSRVFDVLTKSPILKEVNNAYTKPGELFRSESGTLSIRKGETEFAHLNLNLAPGEARIHTGNSFLRIVFPANNSAAALLHKALLSSSSQHVITAKKPREKVNAQGDQAIVLSGIGFTGSSLQCYTPFGSSRIFCDFEINSKSSN